jgi:hypothetical protein
MTEELSSRATWAMKRVLPAVWILIVGLILFVILHAQRASGAAVLPAILPLLIILTVATALNLWFMLPLCRLQMRDGRLYASNFREEIEIRPGDIEQVAQNVWINIRPVTIRLREATPIGKRVLFIPQSRVVFRFWVEDPIVAELRDFALRAVTNPSLVA